MLSDIWQSDKKGIDAAWIMKYNSFCWRESVQNAGMAELADAQASGACSIRLEWGFKSLFLQWILWSAIGWHIMLIRWHFCLYLSEILTIIYVNRCRWVLLRFTGFRAICSQICSQKCSQIFRINKGFVADLKLYVVVKNDCKRKHKH